jgi:hypothetical protein
MMKPSVIRVNSHGFVEGGRVLCDGWAETACGSAWVARETIDTKAASCKLCFDGTSVSQSQDGATIIARSSADSGKYRTS